MLCRRMRLALPPCLALLVVGSLPSSAAEEVWKVEGRILGKEKKSGEVDKSVDVSGIACTTSHGFPRVCLVIDDNRQAGQFVTLRNKKLRAGAELPLMHDKHGDVPLDLDGEGVAYADGAFYVIGSHGRPRNFSQEPDAAAKALIDARTAASSQIVRIRLKAKPGVPLTRSDLRDVRRTSPHCTRSSIGRCKITA